MYVAIESLLLIHQNKINTYYFEKTIETFIENLLTENIDKTELIKITTLLKKVIKQKRINIEVNHLIKDKNFNLVDYFILEEFYNIKNVSFDFFEIINRSISSINNRTEPSYNSKTIIKILNYFKNFNIKKPDYIIIQELIGKDLTQLHIDIFDWYHDTYNINIIQIDKLHLFNTNYSNKDKISMTDFIQLIKSNNKHWEPKSLVLEHDLIANIANSNSIKELILKYTNTSNKRLELYIMKNLHKTHLLEELKFLSDLNLSAELLCNILDSNCLLDYSDFSQMYRHQIKLSLFLNFYSLKKVINLYIKFKKCKYPFYLINDTMAMINIVLGYNMDNTNPIRELIVKPKSIEEIHDFLSKLTQQLKQSNFYLSSQKELLVLEKYKKDDLRIKVPLHNHDLIEIGQELCICVGGGSYAQKIIRNTSNILTVYNKEKLSYCIELNKKKEIIQAKGNYNSTMPMKEQEWIKQIISESF
jgi:hypothetical protein